MRALRAQGIDRNDLPYTAWGQPFFSWYGVGFNIIIIFTQGFTAFMPWNTSNFFVAYISLILFVLLYIGHKAILRQPLVKAAEADIYSGRREVDEMVFEEKIPTTLW